MMPVLIGSEPSTSQLINSAFAEQLNTAIPSAKAFTDIGIWLKSVSLNGCINEIVLVIHRVAFKTYYMSYMNNHWIAAGGLVTTSKRSTALLHNLTAFPVKRHKASSCRQLTLDGQQQVQQ